MDAKHTQGPWKAVTEPPYAAATIWGKHTVPLARVYLLADDRMTRDEQIANARLIAAAPDLLSACQRIGETCERALEHVADNYGQWIAGGPAMGALENALRSVQQLAAQAIARAEQKDEDV